MPKVYLDDIHSPDVSLLEQLLYQAHGWHVYKKQSPKEPSENPKEKPMKFEIVNNPQNTGAVKVETFIDERGIVRICLNGKKVVSIGPEAITIRDQYISEYERELTQYALHIKWESLV